MKKTILLIALITTLISNAQGLNFSSKEQISKFDKFDFDTKGYASTLPSSFSLEKYVPPILSQEGSTCLGYATLYYGLSTMYNEKFDITSEIEKYANSFDPYFIYTLINKSSKCEDGLNYVDAFELQSKIGAKKMFYPSFLNCDSNVEEEQLKRVENYSTPYKIKNYYSTDIDNINFINNIKKAIYNGLPVMVGVQLKKSFDPFDGKKNIFGVKKDGLWKPKPNEKPDGGHAMCVIGYDNVKFGGCFKLANSWGTLYGENGYVYIKYIDFKKAVKEAYIVEIDDNQSKTIDYPNYKRFNFSEPRYKNHIYEGEVNDNFINGYGIYSINHKYFLIGEFNNGVKNGTFICINQDADKLLTIYEYENDEIVKTSGFANNSQSKSIIDFTNYIKKISPNIKVIISDEAPELDLKTKK